MALWVEVRTHNLGRRWEEITALQKLLRKRDREHSSHSGEWLAPEAEEYSLEISSRPVIYHPCSATAWKKLPKNEPAPKEGSCICGWNHRVKLLNLSS